MRQFLLVLAILFTVVVLTSWLFDPFRKLDNAADPGTYLITLAKQDPRLADAFAQADHQNRPNSGPLAERVQAMSAADRQLYGVAWLLIANKGSQAMAIDVEDSSTLWPYRHRLMPFQRVQTENPNIDLGLDNLLAYVLVAGTASPSASEVAVARSILPRLEQHLVATPDSSGIWDTVGCIYFRLGDARLARNAFANALATVHMTGGSASENAEFARQRRLFERRLHASTAAMNGQTVALPLEAELRDAAGPHSSTAAQIPVAPPSLIVVEPSSKPVAIPASSTPAVAR